MLGLGLGLWQLGANRNLVSPSGVAAGLFLDTRANTAFVSGAPSSLASLINVVRATTASDEQPDGSLLTAAVNAARYGGGRGLLIERTATNSIRNSTMVGAVAGTPGTLPTNWGIGFNGSGLSSSVLGTGTESGMTYVDIRVFGTATVATEAFIPFDSTTQIAATTGQNWVSSVYHRVVSGTSANVTGIQVGFIGRQAAGAAGTDNIRSASSLTAFGASAFLRPSVAGTLADVAVAFVRPILWIVHGTGAIDFTIRIGGVQIETGPLATAFIPTSTVAVTRNADQIKVTGAPLTAGIGAGTAFTVFCEYEAPISASASTVWGLTNEAAPTDNDAVYAQVSTSRTGSAVVANTAANSFTNAAAALTVPPLLNRIAMRVAANDAAISHNGAAVISDITIALPAVALTRLVLGGSPGSIGTLNLNGRITRFAAWPSLLSNADLQGVQ
jgi:hypothetical protein